MIIDSLFFNKNLAVFFKNDGRQSKVATSYTIFTGPHIIFFIIVTVIIQDSKQDKMVVKREKSIDV
jgi:hypothetical protein